MLLQHFNIQWSFYSQCRPVRFNSSNSWGASAHVFCILCKVSAAEWKMCQMCSFSDIIIMPVSSVMQANKKERKILASFLPAETGVYGIHNWIYVVSGGKILSEAGLEGLCFTEIGGRSQCRWEVRRKMWFYMLAWIIKRTPVKPLIESQLEHIQV